MKKTIVANLLFFLITNASIGQTLLTQFRQPSGNEWGYISSDGTILIEPKYNGAFNFSEEGLAPVYMDKTNMWNYIDQAGNQLSIPIKNWEPAHILGHGREGFQNGLARIIVKRRYGCINTSGSVVYEPTYEFISPFIDDFATAKNKDDFFILNTKGTVKKLEIPMIETRRFSEGVARFRSPDKQYGLFNTKGEIIVEAKFKSIGYFSSGLAWARTMEGLLGFIDSKGNWVIEPKYSSAKDFDPVSGMARVKLIDQWLYISKTGEELVILDAISFGDFNEGFAYIRINEKFGFINSKGEWIAEPNYDKVKDFSNGMALVRINGLWGAINVKGDEVVEIKFPSLREFANGYAAAEKEREQWGLIDKKGAWVIEPIYGRIKDVQLIP